MATQEPNVYAGLAVVVGGLMHARPKFFAKVMGELLFWVGEDKMLFGSDYAIWEPKWQIEGLLDWEMPDDAEFSDYPRWTTRASARSSASTPPSSTASRCRRSCGSPCRPRAGAPTRERGGRRDEPAAPSPRRSSGRSTTRSSTSRSPRSASSAPASSPTRATCRCACGCPTPQCAPNFAFLMAADARAAVGRVPGVRATSRRARGPLHGRRRSTPRSRGGDGFADAFPGETRGRARRAARAVPAQGAARPPGAAVEALLRGRPGRGRALRVPTCPRRGRGALHRAARGARAPRDRDAPALVAGDGAAPARRPDVLAAPRWRR